MGDVHHFGLHQVFPGLVGPVGSDSLFHLVSGELAFRPAGLGQHLVAGGLNGAGFVAVDMARHRGDDALMGAQGGADHSEVGLGAAYQEVDVHIIPAAFPADQGPGLFAVLVLAVANGLFQVCFLHFFQDMWVCPFRIVAVEIEHGYSSLSFVLLSNIERQNRLSQL